MIKFFRQIRQNLVTENKISKYLLYAIGEILLVVIGIMIALSIKNWNEEQNLKTQEIKILKELLVNLEADSADHAANAVWYINSSSAARIIVNTLEARSAWNDSMAVHYGWLYLKGQANLNTSAYDNLKAIGFSIISNDSIRIGLTHLHSSYYDRLLKFEKEIAQDHGTYIVMPVLVKRLRMDKWFHATPLDYETLLDDLEFREVVRFRGISMDQMKIYCIDARDATSNLMQMIRRELVIREESD